MKVVSEGLGLTLQFFLETTPSFPRVAVGSSATLSKYWVLDQAFPVLTFQGGDRKWNQSWGTALSGSE